MKLSLYDLEKINALYILIKHHDDEIRKINDSFGLVGKQTYKNASKVVKKRLQKELELYKLSNSAP